MKILLVGYGKMGKAIERIALERGHTIAGRVDVHSPDQIEPGADVAIEFTQPESAWGNVRRCLETGIPVVVGTTGWLQHLEEAKQLCVARQGAFFYASNYSLGVNIFFKLNEYLAKLMSKQVGYEVLIDETHHTQKKDSPSGTAITLAEGILRHHPGKEKWVNHTSEHTTDLVIRSHRVDPAPGTHTIEYRSAVDDISITHTAHSREGFALGAVLVAEWIQGRRGCFSMDDFLTF